MTVYAVQRTAKGWTVTVEQTDGRTFITPSVITHKATREKAERLARRLAGRYGRVLVF